MSVPVQDIVPTTGEYLRSRRHEHELLRLLADGRLVAVHRALRRNGRRDLLAVVAATDAQARALAIDTSDAQAVLEAVERYEPPDSRLRFWAYAVLAERLLLNFDPTAYAVATTATDALARCRMPVLPSLALRYAQARLARVQAAGLVGAPGEGVAERALRLREQAVSELLGCGFVDEVHVTNGLALALVALVRSERLVENHAGLREARIALGDHDESVWPVVLDMLLALLALEVDPPGAAAAADRIAGAAHFEGRLPAVAGFCHAWLRAVDAGASDSTVAELDAALRSVRRKDPRFAQGLARHAAHALADLGSPAVLRFARLDADLGAVGPEHALERQILRQRAAAASGGPVEVEEALALLSSLHTTCRRGAARLALRLGHDLVRLPGRIDDAVRLHDWGRARMPPDERLTPWERWWSRPVDDRTSRPPGLAALVGRSPQCPPSTDRLGLRLMAPTAEATLDGRPIRLSAAQLKLLVALALEHPAPLNVEQASDLLWPDLPATATRRRLNALVYRLRGLLDGRGDVVWRDGELLGIDPERCEVDLWRFRRSLTGEASERHQAVVELRGLVCDAQFPYDERFVDERRHLLGAWLTNVRALLRSGELARADLGSALAALRLRGDDLGI